MANSPQRHIVDVRRVARPRPQPVEPVFVEPVRQTPAPASSHKKARRFGRRALAAAVGLVVAVILITVLGLAVVEGVIQYRKLKTQTAEPQYTATDLAAQAKQQQDNGDLAGAEKSLQEAIVRDAKLDYKVQVAVLQYRQKKYADAVDSYNALIKASENPAFAWNGLGNVYRDWSQTEVTRQVERQKEAENAYRQAIVVDPTYAAAYSNLALFLSDLNRTNEAIQWAKKGATESKNSDLSALVIRLGVK